MSSSNSSSTSSSSQTIRIPINKTIPWKHNGSRFCNLATAGAQAYYAIFIDEINIILHAPLSTSQDARGLFQVHVQGLGEWDLNDSTTMAQSLVLVVDPDDVEENKDGWHVWAEAARQAPQARHDRFVCGTWKRDEKYVTAPGFFKGILEFPLLDILGRSGLRHGRVKRRQLVASFGCGCVPWRNAYPITPLLEWHLDANTGRCTGDFTVPHTSAPVSPEDPWRKVFPPDVLQRFLQRFVQQANEQQQGEKQQQP